MNNEEKLAKFFDEFIEIGGQLIRADLITRIQEAIVYSPDNNEGIVINTSRDGSIYIKAVKYEDFIKQLRDARESLTKESLRVEEMSKPVYLGDTNLSGTLEEIIDINPSTYDSDTAMMRHTYLPAIPKDSAVSFQSNEIKGPGTGKILPLKSNIRTHRSEITIDNKDLLSAQGDFSLLEGEVIVDRQNIVVMNEEGRRLGYGYQDGNGTIVGSNVSGIINCSGKYRLVFKDISAEGKIYVSYSVKGK